jgi:phosphoglucomutase
MAHSPLAGQTAPTEMLIDVDALVNRYYTRHPDPLDPQQAVRFGTSGHRGTPEEGTFTEDHIVAVTQAICDYRAEGGITGPLFMGKDTHALSTPAQRTALEVLAGNGVETMVQHDEGVTPTPVISHAILRYNSSRVRAMADGIVITPSHNPPRDGGFKYNPPHGGPADTSVTRWVQQRANALLRTGNRSARRMPYEAAARAATTHYCDLMTPYVRDLASVIDLECIRGAGIRMGVDPLGGASVHYWEPIKAMYGIDLTSVNLAVDPRFGFMTVDHDGKIRMDCSSPFAMARLIELKDRFEIAFANDPDADRHGIVTRTVGLMNPSHYLAVAIRYLLEHRPFWHKAASVGKTVVSSVLIDRVVHAAGRRLCEFPVGFKWFVDGFLSGSCCFAGEESAGATFLRRAGTVWTTDKDGLIMDLLAAEMMARTGKDPGELYRELASRFGTPHFKRFDMPADSATKTAMTHWSSKSLPVKELADEKVLAIMSAAPANGAPIGGLKVITENGWFAVRLSATHDLFKLYAESLKSPLHLEMIVEQAQELLSRTLAAASG